MCCYMPVLLIMFYYTLGAVAKLRSPNSTCLYPLPAMLPSMIISLPQFMVKAINLLLSKYSLLTTAWSSVLISAPPPFAGSGVIISASHGNGTNLGVQVWVVLSVIISPFSFF